MKRCTKCKSVKALEDFPKQSSRVDGRHTHCKECRSKYFAFSYNPEERRTKYLSKHQEEKEARKQYYINNKQSYFVNKVKRRTRLLNAVPAWYDDFDNFVLKEAYDLCKLREKLCGVPFEVDHIIPLQGKNACGLHWHKNWQVITRFENRSKGNR